MEVLSFVISKRNVTCVKNNLIDVIGDNADYEARFVFDGEWVGKIKTARFVNPRTNRYKDAVLENDTCIIPVEMLKKGFLNIGVFSDVMTTKPCEVLVRESIKEKTGSVQPPTEDVYGQIMALLNDIEAHKLTPVGKTDEMTQEVGRDAEGKLYTKPGGGGGGGGGISDHRLLDHRDAANQHPMSAIDGLIAALAGKQPTGEYITEEHDPTVPVWAKQPSKPSYTASEVHALPDDTVIPDALSDLADDATHRLVTDAEKSAWNAKQSAISDLETIRTGAAAGATAVQPEEGKGLFSGNYDDLANKPTIPSALSQLSDDSTHRTVTDTEKSTWNGKQSKITASGMLKGDGDGGVSVAVPGIDYLTIEEADNKYAEKSTGATAGNIAVFDEDGKLVDSGHSPDDFVKYGAVTVTISATDGAIPAQGDGVSVQLYHDTELIDTVVYNNQPVTFSGLTPNASYKVQSVGTWSGHYRPTPAFFSFNALSGATTSVAIVYASMTIPETLQELADIIQNGGTQFLTIGTQFTIPWRDVAENVDYNVPVDIVDVREIEDQYGVTHDAAIIQWHYTTPFSIQFDADEGVAATETTAEAGLYYYGKTGSTYTLLNLSAGDPIPYSDYDSVVKSNIEDTSSNSLRFGYNRYRDSAVRQFLNSESGVGEWWVATHVGDNAPSQLSSRAGFLSGFSAADLALMKPCKITCYTNRVTDASVIDTMYDRWWIASGTEMYGAVNDNEGTYYPYWKSATGLPFSNNSVNTGRVAYSLTDHSFAQRHWLRSATRSYSYNPWAVSDIGGIGNSHNANAAYAALPVCAIY